MAVLVEHLELAVLETLTTLTVCVEGVDSGLLGRRVALGGDEVAWSRELGRILMEVRPCVYHHIARVLLPFHGATWTLLELVQGGEDLGVWVLPTIGEHDGLASGILGRRNST